MSERNSKFKKEGPFIPALSDKLVALIQKNGLKVQQLEPIGFEIHDVDVRDKLSDNLIELLEVAMGERGFLVFKQQTGLSPEELLKVSQWWGGKQIHSTHGVHPATPNRNRHIFRLSNENSRGIHGVGPQWHNDGSFEAATFSHSAYYMVQAPKNGGGTHFAHQGGAFDVLPEEKQQFWQRLVSVNSASGVTHPLVHVHPISGKKSVWLHLGMTGAVIERLPEKDLSIDELKATPASFDKFRLLDREEMIELFNDYNDLLNDSFELGYGIKYEYDTGDLLFIDNWALAHRAAPEAHMPKEKQGLRVLDRVTIKSNNELKPHFGLPQFINISQPNPFGSEGVWQAGGVGFRWKEQIPMQN